MEERQVFHEPNLDKGFKATEILCPRFFLL
jgi:hypothetical protein